MTTTLGMSGPIHPESVSAATDNGDGASPILASSAEAIADAVLTMIHQLQGIKSRLASSHEGNSSPLFLLVKLVRLGPCRVSDLAELVCTDQSTVSRQVATLVKSGLVERRADPDDGRASILVPTEQGLVKAGEQTARRGAVLQPVIADWPQRDRDELLRLLPKYTDGIEVHREQIIATALEHHDRAGLNSRGTAPPANSRT